MLAGKWKWKWKWMKWNGMLCHALGGPVILFSLQHFIAPALDYCLYGEESGTLSPQVKKWHSAFRATFSIKICTYSCMHVQYKQHMQASLKYEAMLHLIIIQTFMVGHSLLFIFNSITNLSLVLIWIIRNSANHVLVP